MKTPNLKKHLIKSFTGSFLTKVGGIGLGLLVNVVLARLLGPSNFGVYSYILAIMSILVIPVQMGLPRLLVREVAYYNAKDQWGYVKDIFHKANYLVFLTGVVLGMGVLMLVMYFSFYVEPLKRSTFYVGVPLLVIMPLSALRSSTLKGLKKVVPGILPEEIGRRIVLLILVGILVIFYGTGRNLTPPVIMNLAVLSFLTAFILGGILLSYYKPEGTKKRETSITYRGLIRRTMPFMLLGGLSIINRKVDIVLLGMLGTSDQVGLFQVATRSAAFITIILSTVNMVVAPLFSDLWARQNVKQLQQILTKSTQVIIAFSLPVALLFIFWGGPILGILFGAEFVGADLVLAILSLGYLFNAATGSVGKLLNMTGYEYQTAWAIGFSAVSNIILNILLIPRYGMEGAAVASLISFLIWNVYLGWMVYKKLRIIPSVFYLFANE